MKATPGPWIRNGENSKGYSVICRGPAAGWTIALALPGPGKNGREEMEANANLIISAPDLLEAVKDLLCAVSLAREEQHILSFGEALRTDGYDESADNLANKIQQIIEKSRAAIARAEGRE